MNDKAKRKNPDLPQLLDFDDTDLKANRAGILSQRQQKNLQRGDWELFISAVIVRILWITALGIVFTTLVRIFILYPRDNPLVVLPSSVLFVLFWGYLKYREWRKRREIRIGKMSSVQGKLTKHIKNHSKGVSLFVQVEQQKFIANSTLFNLFQEGEIYTLYYLPLNRHIVAVEHLPAENPS